MLNFSASMNAASIIVEPTNEISLEIDIFCKLTLQLNVVLLIFSTTDKKKNQLSISKLFRLIRPMDC